MIHDRGGTGRAIFCALVVSATFMGRSSAALDAEKTREALLKTPMPEWPMEPISEAERKKATELFTQMAKAPEEIKIGKVGGRETLLLLPSKQQRSHDWYLVFDNAGRKRFRNLARGRTHHYIRNPQEITTWLDVPGRPRPYSINRRHVDTKQILWEAVPPNLESIGFSGEALFRPGTFDVLEFKRMILENSPTQFVGMQETQDNLIVLMKEYRQLRPRNDEHAKRQYRSAFWIDPEKGNRQVKAAEWRKISEDAEWTLINVWTVAWAKINGVFVPKHYRALVNQNGIRDLKLELKWESVNAPIDDSEFKWQKFNPPIGTKIINYKTGEPVVESRVGESNSNQ